MYSYGPPHMADQKQDDHLEHTYSSYVRIRDVALKTCQRRWTIGRSGEKRSGISVLAARHDDDDISYYDMFSITWLILHFDSQKMLSKISDERVSNKSFLKCFKFMQTFQTTFYANLCFFYVSFEIYKMT